MNTPDKCPKCGEEIMYYGHRFSLAGERSEERCLKVQRDQLAERVNLIEIERDELKVKVSFDELALQKIEERVKRLEEAADAMANAYEEIIFDRHDAGILEEYRKVRGEK